MKAVYLTPQKTFYLFRMTHFPKIWLLLLMVLKGLVFPAEVAATSYRFPEITRQSVHKTSHKSLVLMRTHYRLKLTLKLFTL